MTKRGQPHSTSGNPRNLVVQLVENADRDVENFPIHVTIRSDRFGQWDGNNFVPPQRRHLSKFAAVHHVDGAQSVARRQHAVVGGRRSATLDVSKHYGPRLEARPLFNFASYRGADSAQPDMPEFIAASLRASSAMSFVAIGKVCALCHHHNAEVSSPI